MSDSSEPIKLWINNDWYIPVDEAGYCVGESAEGALGFVIKLQRSREENRFTALKIPRLMGDTHRDNAYTCQLMEQELSAVEQVETARTPVPKLNLLSVANATNLLRGEIRTIPGDREGAQWDRSIVMVHFAKGKAPRFCLVKQEGDELKTLPSGVAPIDLKTYHWVKDLSHSWSQTVFVEKSPAAQPPNTFAASMAFDRDSVGETWYVGLPSVNYSWAPGTLQESISLVREPKDNPDAENQSLRGQWSVKQHLELAEQLCRALYTLHSRSMLHADLRPANIVFQAQPEHPTSYFVSDYGSFAQAAPSYYQSLRDGVGQTMGPVMVGERASAFYAPERRLGREREASDTAVIRPRMDPRACLQIVLGWRSDLIDESGNPNEKKLEEYIAQATQPPTELPDKILRAGDRVQLRENIFELIEDEKRIGDKQVLICEYNYWQIYHGRVAVRVPVDQEPKSIKWFPIPRTIELMKWSVATDLYSLGALLLYSIFRNKIEPQDNGSEVEDQFREMLVYLNNESYFNAVWPELDWLRFSMEEQLNDHEVNRRTYSAEAFRGIAFKRHNLTERTGAEQRNSREKEPVNLLEAAEELTNRLTQTAPGIRRIVVGLDYNLAAFVFVMHFALCCLHRESHFTEEQRKSWAQRPEWIQQLPFCKDRRENPEHSTATRRALDRLVQLQVLIARGELKAMKPRDTKEIGSFDPRPDVSIRIERDDFKRRLEALEPENHSLKEELAVTNAARLKLNDYTQQQHSQIEQLHDYTQQQHSQIEKLHMHLQNATNTLNAREQLLGQLQGALKEIEAQAGSGNRFIESPELRKIRETVARINAQTGFPMSNGTTLARPPGENEDDTSRPS
jgi:serine/threonine protein kinase